MNKQTMAEQKLGSGEEHVVYMAEEGHTVEIQRERPFDWFASAVLGYLLCPITGICAMYYAARANHAADWRRDEEDISRHNGNAKCFTCLSVWAGIIIIIVIVFVLVQDDTTFGKDFNIFRILSLYRG